MRTIAGESLIILRDRDGELRAFFNVCRHRGTRLCTEASGHFSETIQCPYHAWTYTTDGRLIGAPHMQDVEGFDKRDYPLHAAARRRVGGIRLREHRATIRSPFDRVVRADARTGSRVIGLGALEVGHRVTYDVHANWKLVFQNYSECLHCPMIHPELATVLPYQSGANDLIEGPFLGGYMEITAPNESATMSGRACGRLVSAACSDGRSAARVLLLAHAQHAAQHSSGLRELLLVTPVAPTARSSSRSGCLHPANDGDPAFNPADAIAFWDVTNRQDWDIVAAQPARHRVPALRAGPVFAAREHSRGVGSRST